MHSPGTLMRRGKRQIGRLLGDLRFHAYVDLWGRTPIIVYQIGKVGSSSVTESLRAHGLVPVYHIHRLHPENIRRVQQAHASTGEQVPEEHPGKRLYANVVKQRRAAKFITLVREPISRNISAFFQNLRWFMGTNSDPMELVTEELVDLFIQDYEHTVPLTWFDVEMKRTLGIDVYRYPFPKENGYLTIKEGDFHLLILKAEVDDLVKQAAIADFLGLEDFDLFRTNVAEDKNYAALYRDFKDTIRLPQSYVNIMCDSAYTRHFYTASEIAAVRASWQGRIQHTALPPAIYRALRDAACREGDRP